MTIWVDRDNATGAVEIDNTLRREAKFPYLLRGIVFFYNLIAWPVRRARRLREMRLLLSMSDRDLSDIGLRRQDVNDVVTLPLTWDTGHFLLCRRNAKKR